MNSEEKTPSIESLQRTIEACAWLIDIAQYSVDHYGWSSVIVKYLDVLGSGAHGALVNGGMGVVTPMERSATDVEMSANTIDYRGRFLSQIAASPARHDKQAGGSELMQ